MVDSQRQCDQNKKDMMMDKKLPFRSQLADLLLSDMICLTIESLLLTGSTELVRNHCSSSNIDEPIPTHRHLQKITFLFNCT